MLARLDSERLPRKALLQVGGRSLFEICISRILRSSGLARVVLATTNRRVDDELAAAAMVRNIPVFRGATEDVAARCVECARAFEASHFLRVNADSPFPDPGLVDEGLKIVRKNVDCDLVTNLIGRSFPYGISLEIVRTASLKAQLAKLNVEEREHVTKSFYVRPENFRIHTIVADRPDLKNARMTVDTASDFEMLCRVANHFDGRLDEVSYAELAEFYISHHHTLT